MKQEKNSLQKELQTLYTIPEFIGAKYFASTGKQKQYKTNMMIT